MDRVPRIFVAHRPLPDNLRQRQPDSYRLNISDTHPDASDQIRALLGVIVIRTSQPGNAMASATGSTIEEAYFRTVLPDRIFLSNDHDIPDIKRIECRHKNHTHSLYRIKM